MKTVLLIDDDPVVRRLLTRSLEKAGWRIAEAEDADSGIKQFRKYRPEAVVVDLLMPNVNGFTAISMLREESSSPHTRIVAVSSKSFRADRERALQSGADVFMAKPLDPAELVSLLQELTAAPGRGQTRGVEGPSIHVRFWGVRGSIPAPGPSTVYYGGNTPCVEVRTGGEIIVLDSGTGIRDLGTALTAEFDGKPLQLTLLITHTHWDHIQGFPFFLPAYNPKNRISVLGYEGARAGLAGIFSHQMESPYFPIALQKLPGNIVITELKDMEFNIGKVKVRAAFANHPGICVGYRLESEAGSVAYLPDNEPFHRRHSLRKESVSGRAANPEGFRGKSGGTQFALAEDQKLIEFIRGVDLLILDAQYDSEEYRQHVGWGHGCMEDAVSLASRARVKQLYLFHHDPNHDDITISRMVQEARKLAEHDGAGVRVDAAREGQTWQPPKAPGSAPESVRVKSQRKK